MTSACGSRAFARCKYENIRKNDTRNKRYILNQSFFVFFFLYINFLRETLRPSPGIFSLLVLSFQSFQSFYVYLYTVHDQP